MMACASAIFQAEGEHDGDNGGERLRDGCHGQGDGEEEGVHHVSCRHSTLTPNSTAQITRMMIDSFLPNWSRLT